MSGRERTGTGRSARLAGSAIAATLLILTVALAGGSALGRGISNFGGDGRAVTRFEVHLQRSGSLEDLAVGPDGEIALATEGKYAQPIQLAFLNADGSPDRSFAGDGLSQPQLGPGRPLRDDPVRLAFTGRGRDLSLLVAGTVEKRTGGTELEIRKYRADGHLDRGFGRAGTVDSPGAAAVALLATPGGGFVLFADGSYSGGTVSRFGPDGAYLGSGAPKWLPPFQHVSAGAGDGFLAEVGGSGATKPTLVRFDPEGRITRRSTPSASGRSRFSLIGEDADGRALGWLDDSLVRLRPDDRSVDAGFHGGLPPCGDGGRATRPDGALTEPSGGILIVNDCGLIRLGPGGGTDPTFAGGGYMTAAGGAAQLAPGPDGTVLYARWRGKQALPAIGRLDHGGAPDGRFGSGGSVSLRLPAPRASAATALVAADGHLLAAGSALCGSECERFALARYGARTGRLDRGFGQGGKALGATGLGSASGVAVAPGGDIVAVGTSSEPSGDDPERSFVLQRFHPSGRPDLRFGKRGIVVDQLAKGDGRSEANAVAIQENGKIVVAGLAACPSAGLCLTVARYLPGGSRDRSFAHGGVFRLDGGIQAGALGIANDGKIVVTGGEAGYFDTLRLTRRGRLDRSFGDGGIVVHRQRVSFKKLLDYSIGPKALALGPGGSVTVAGGTQLSHAIFERYLPDGRRDPGFGHRGRLLVQRLGVTALAATRCGIVAAGSLKTPGHQQQMAVAGIDRSGRVHLQPRPLFGPDRRSGGSALALAGGNAIVAGYVRAYSFGSEFALAATPLGKLLPRC